MASYLPAPPEQKRPTDENLRKAARAGGNWFFWIVAFTLVNEASIRFGKQGILVLGLAISQIIALVTHQVGGVAGWFGIAVTLALCGAFVLFGIYAKRGEGWAYGTGMFLYAADSAIYAFFGDWFAFAFHLLPLFFLFVSWSAWRELRRREAVAQRLEAAAREERPEGAVAERPGA